MVVPTDVTDRGAVEALAGRTLETFGRIDILINNAGVMLLSPIRALKVDEWDHMLNANVHGALYCIASVLPAMLEQGSGHVVNVSSVAGRRPMPSGTIYSATKFALRAVSQGMHLELSASDRIRVTDIEPGVVATELADHITDEETARRFKENWKTKEALGADDIAGAILYAVAAPARVNVNEILVRPTDQPT